MKELYKEFKYKNFLYSQVKRDGKFAIYKFTDPKWPSKRYYYDVITIRQIPFYIFPNGVAQEAHEAYVNGEHYGKISWVYPELNMAEKKFEELVKANKLKEIVSLKLEN